MANNREIAKIIAKEKLMKALGLIHDAKMDLIHEDTEWQACGRLINEIYELQKNLG